MWDFKKSEVLILILIFILNLFFIIYFYNKILQKTEYYFTYPLDDTYIHLAMAKNFKNHKVIGINGEFASTTSSPLFTLILSFLFLIFGDRADLSLILNIIISFILLGYTFLILRKLFKSNYIFMLLTVFYFLIPFPTLIFSGLEHLLHILFVLIFLNTSLSSIVNEEKKYISLFIFAMVASAIRYESIFFIFPFLLLFLYKKKIKDFLSTAFGTLMPILIYGIYSLKKGWFFLPSSIVLKGYLFNFGSIENIFLNAGQKIYNDLLINPYLIPPLLFSLFSIYFLSPKIEFFKSKVQVLSFSFFVNLILHLHFAKTGWFYRYEAYLLAFFFILIINSLTEFKFKNRHNFLSKISLFLIFILGSIPFIVRSVNALSDIPYASKNIYEQQIQMAKFLQRYYEKDWVGVNDIGAVCYFKENVLDIWGLGNIQITKKMINFTYDKEYLSKIIIDYNIRAIVIYEKTFEYLKGVPDGLICAGRWKIKDNKVCGYDTISFYAMKKDIKYLVMNLREFSKSLPKDVIQSGLYLE